MVLPCPDCGAVVDASAALWEQHGPEAFAEPPVCAEEDAERTVRSPFVAGVLFGFGLLATLPLTLLWWSRGSGSVRVELVLCVWSVVAVAVEWLFVASRLERRGRESAAGSSPSSGPSEPSGSEQAGDERGGTGER